MKIDRTILHETLRIAVGVAALCAVMCAVFLILRRFDLSVLLGALLGWAITVGNFFLMGLSVQAVLGKGDAATKFMRNSHTLRTLLCLVLAGVGIAALHLNPFAVILPLLFPTPLILLMRALGLTPKDDAPAPEETEEKGEAET